MRLGLLVLLAVLAGCTGTPPPPSPGTGGPLRFDPMVVTLTPTEPNETLSAPVRVAWSEQAFAASSENPGEFPAEVVRAAGSTYVTRTHMGWVRFPFEDPRGVTIGVQAQALDLRSLLGLPGYHGTRTQTNGVERIAGDGRFTIADQDLAYHVEAEARDGHVVSARVATKGAREAPYAFAAGGALLAPAGAPAESLGFDEAARQDAAAGEAHAAVAKLIDAYARNHAGLVPERVTPEDLRIEVLASGKPWPTNPFTDQPLAEAEAHGGLHWTKCDASSARYLGYGWDGKVSEARWGATDCR
ncbi:MAG: hypothetical protein LC624_01120 [Halobacteriales archaeon]|nr:hypothetical protein [Halobacteriales archaeon]